MEFDPDGRAPTSATPRDSDAMLQFIEDARERLTRLEVSCHTMLDGHSVAGSDGASVTLTSSAAIDSENELLRVQIAQLKTQLAQQIHRREQDDLVFQRAMAYASAKGTANAVLHTLFDQASAAKHQVLESWWETGVIPTRDGLKHWRLDLREIRNETGASILHVAVDASIARQNLKVKMVELLVDRLEFDVNVRDVFGRTPLHVASMAGLAEVTQALLDRGADPLSRDRAGLTPLSVVRTLSKPPEEVVQQLVAAETKAMKGLVSASHRVPRERAISTALFLQSIAQFVVPEKSVAFHTQSAAFLHRLVQATHSSTVELDNELRELMPILFDYDGYSRSPVLIRLETLFDHGAFYDASLLDLLQLEAGAYGLSLVASICPTASALAGASWEGLLQKLIIAHKTSGTSAAVRHEASTTDVSSLSDGLSSPRSDSSATSTDHRGVHQARQAWHYAVLMKAATRPLPGVFTVKKGDAKATCSEDIGRLFPLDDRLILGSTEYHCVSYDSATGVLQLDREYEGVSADAVKAYQSGSISSLSPPYITAKRLWEREPGNKYEEHMSAEQELFQDYQFLDPDSEFEVAVKLGPVPTAREARALVDEWRAQTRKLFDEKKCLAGLPHCSHYCPQRSGHSLCVDTMAAVGRELAKERLGRPTFSKQLKPRASLQKYQNLFQGHSPWPGSPSSVPHASNVDTIGKRMPPIDLDLT